MKTNIYLSAIGTTALLLLSGCGDSGDNAKISPPSPTPTPPAATATQASASTGTGTGAAASTAVSTGTATAAAASTGTGTGTGASTEAAADSGARTKIGNSAHTIAVPAAFKVENVQKPMRAMTMTVAKSEGDAEDGELSVFIFPGKAGGLQANVDRWANQFGGKNSIKDQRDVKTDAGISAKVVEIEGDFAGGMGAPAKPNYKMLGAFIETGDDAHVFKLVGPPKTINAHKAEFDKMIASFK
jgi:hypothetical protein